MIPKSAANFGWHWTNNFIFSVPFSPPPLDENGAALLCEALGDPWLVRVMSELRAFVLLLNLTVMQQSPQGSDERPIAGKV